jgi:hypothetical protein
MLPVRDETKGMRRYNANGSQLQLTIYIFDGATPIIRLSSEVSTLLNVNRSALADLVA